MSRLLAAVCLASAAVSVSAATQSIWTDTTDLNASWQTDANWSTGSYPNSADADAVLCDLDANVSQTISVGDTSYSLSELWLNALTGSAAHTLRTLVTNRKSQYSSGTIPFHLHIANPNAFKGYVAASESFTYLDIDTTAGFVPRYEHVSDSQLMVANVTNEGTRAEIGDLYGQGVLLKQGSGTLTVESGDGIGNAIYLEQGALEVGDPDPVDVEALLKTALLRLDASKEGTLLTETRGGYTYVTNWLDANGGTILAKTPTTVAGFNSPFMSEFQSETGLPLVDFGGLGTDASVPTNNCYLALSREITTGREFFYAGYYTQWNYNPVFGSEDWQYHTFYPGVSQLFDLAGVYAGVCYGDIAFNGVKREYTFNPGYDRYRMHVQSVGTLSVGGKVGALCTDMAWNIPGRSGGIRLGEVLIFETELTAKQRRAINRYLLKKWRAGSADCDIGSVFVRGSANEITVPAGATATVHRVYTDGCTLVKKGDGTLRVGAVLPVDGCQSAPSAQPSASVRVEGGHVAITGEGTPEEAPVNPAADPMLWLDATTGPFAVTEEGGKTFLNVWYDRRENEQRTGYPRARTHEQSDDARAYTGNKPFVRLNSFGTKTGVDFGKQADSNTSWMRLLRANGSILYSDITAYEGYIVFAVNTSSQQWPIWGSSTTRVSRNWWTAYCGETRYNHGDLLAARWTLDGLEIDPSMTLTNTSGKCGFLANACHVGSFSSDVPLPMDLLAKVQLDTPLLSGDITIGEYIIYDHRLTDDERRQTEAYLMNKWQGMTHPDRRAAPVLSFADDVDAAYDVAGDVSVERVSGGNGNVVKSGEGSLSVSDAASSNIKTVSVSGGSMALAYGDESEGLLTPSFRFDAADEASLQCAENSTELLNWLSSGTCLYEMEANRSAGDSLVTANPTVETVEMRDGVSRPCVNFGPTAKIGDWGYHPEGTAGFRIEEKDKHGNPYNMCWLLQEAYAIVADIPNTSEPSKFQNIFSQDNRNEYRREDFYRGANGALFTGGSDQAQNIRDGYIGLDGVQTNRDAVLPTGFHLVSVQPVVDAKADKFCIDAMAINADETAGGLKIAEYVAYKGQHTPRQRTFIEQTLMHKWFGMPAAKWTHELDSISVSSGSSVLFSGENMEIVVPSISGSGTIEVPRVSAVESIQLVSDGESIEPITVDGTVAFGESVSVRIDSERILRLRDSSCAILVATKLENVNFGTWSVEAPVKSGYSLKLRQAGGIVYLDVQKPGFSLIVR